jgi:hypothetical protein
MGIELKPQILWPQLSTQVLTTRRVTTRIRKGGLHWKRAGN